MVADFRSERMASPEGEGRAKGASEEVWTGYYRANKTVNQAIFAVFPGLRTALKGYASAKLFDLFGFWLAWHLFGGFEGIQKGLGLSRSGVFRRVALFREIFGEHPDVYEFPGVAVDAAAFLAGMSERKLAK